MTWRGLKDDPLPWLLEPGDAAVRHLALRQLLDRAADDPGVVEASAAAMSSGPIAAILSHQEPGGHWVKPGPGYSPKYRATVWQVIFLDQMGADGRDPRVRAACEYVLENSRSENGGFGASAVRTQSRPATSRVIHCLNGNLVAALLGLGYEDDPRVQEAIEWQARAILGEGAVYEPHGTTGPGFGCAANSGLPCAWGAIKALVGLTRVAESSRSDLVQRAIDAGAEFLLGRDPRNADYPAGKGDAKPSQLWFKPGFPSAYVADVLQNLEVLCSLGYAGDERLQAALTWLLAKQDSRGRWRNELAYNRRTWVDFDKQGTASKWVTLRACRVLKAVDKAAATAP